MSTGTMLQQNNFHWSKFDFTYFDLQDKISCVSFTKFSNKVMTKKDFLILIPYQQNTTIATSQIKVELNKANKNI